MLTKSNYPFKIEMTIKTLVDKNVYRDHLYKQLELQKKDGVSYSQNPQCNNE